MNGRIAVFANAWSEKCLSDAIEGVQVCAKRNDFDIFVFLGHAAPGMSEDEQREEKRIYQLPDLTLFDGVIVFSSTMNFPELVEDIRIRTKKANVPAVSVGIKVEGMSFVEMGNRESMEELVSHLVEHHHVRDIEFIAGPEGNENSDIRVNAVKSIFAKNEIPFFDECVHHGDWSIRGAMEIAREIIKKRRDNLPDAIICANDGLAMATCSELEKEGIRIPEDVIVTGYDNIYDGQIFFPALCTVGQNDYIVGSSAAEMLVRMIKESPVLEELKIKTHFIKNQSCGCGREDIDTLRIKECKARFYEKLEQLEFGWSNGWIAQCILEDTNLEKLREHLEDYFKNSNVFGTIGTSYVLLDENAKEYMAGNEEAEHNSGYSDCFDVLCAVNRRNVVDCKRIRREEMIPGYQKEENVSKTFLFFPVHFVDWVFGYVVVEDWISSLCNRKLKIFCDNFNYTVNKLKQNIALERLNEKLTDLYTKDALTGMYNRFGFDSEGVKIYDSCCQNQEHMVLMFTDINRMKLINDYYGHLQGDIAIKTVAAAIQNSIQDNWIAIRFGGDEFLVVGKCQREAEIEAVKEKITRTVKQSNAEQQFPFYLSVSCGYLHFVPEQNRTLDSYVKQVDEVMYEIKAFMHMQDTELRDFVEKCAQIQQQ